MIPFAYRLVLGLSAPSAFTGTFSISDRSSAQLHSVLPGSTPAAAGEHPTAIDLNTTPQADLELVWPEVAFALSYGTTFSYLDVMHAETRTFNLINLARAGVTWSTPRLRLSLTQTISFGQQSYATLTTPAPTPSGAPSPPGTTGVGSTLPQGAAFVPVIQTYSTYSFTSSAGASYLVDRGTTVAAGASYQFSGGADQNSGTPAVPGATAGTGSNPPSGTGTNSSSAAGAVYVPIVQTAAARSIGGYAGISSVIRPRITASVNVIYQQLGGSDDASRAVLPEQTSRGGNASVLYAVSGVDQLVTGATSAYTTVSNGAAYTTATLIETWKHRFSPLTEGSLGAGGTYLRSRTAPGEPLTDSALPAGLATVTHTIRDGHATWTLRGGVALGATTDPLAGRIQEQVSGAVAAVWAQDELAVTASADAAETLPPHSPNATRVAGAGLLAMWTPAPLINLSAGNRIFLQDTTLATAPNLPLQWLVFVGLTLRAPPLDF